MEAHSDYTEESSDQKKAKSLDDYLSSQEKEKKRLGSILKFDKYDDVHPQVLKNMDNNLSPKSKQFHRKRQFERKFHKREELVRYMSNLPNFLEKGEKPQDKAFNIGVLDWRLLENWQHSHPNRGHVPSNSNISSSKGSSPRPQERIVPSHSNAPPTKGRDCEISKVTESKFRDSNLDTIRFRPAKGSQLDRTCFVDIKSANFPSEVKDKIPFPTSSSNSPSRMKNLENRESDSIQSNLSGNVVSQGKTGISETKDSQLDRTCFEDVKSANCPSEVKERIPFPRSNPNSPSRMKNRENRESDSIRSNLSGNVASQGKMGISETKDSHTRSSNFPPEVKEKIPFPKSNSNSPSRIKNLENRESDSIRSNLSGSVASKGKMGISETRNRSPTRRFSFCMGRNGESSCLNPAPEKISDSKVICSSACSHDSTGEKSNPTNRSRSSPLKRLLDPLLKQKGSDHFPVRNTDRRVKSSNGQKEPPASRSLKAKLDLKGCRADDIDIPQPIEKNGSSRMQALLQVAVKNGLPLFTFTVDNCSDILAATVKELSSKKTLHRWVYTFFSFSEMKKKNMYWINKGGNHGYIPNVIAQMKVSDLPCAIQKGLMREFVLSSIVSKDVLDQMSCPMPSEELAAILIKFPEKILIGDGYRSEKASGVNLEEAFEEFDSLSSKDEFFSATVILPGGRHGVPSKGLGEPSPLIERWKSGGSCDCGGWDLGCRLRVLASRDFSNVKSNSTKARSITAFKLFSQEEVEENKQPIFILSPFEDGIFSVEFNSSLTLIQAFSIGISVLSSRKMATLPPNVFGDKVSEESEQTPAKFSDRAPAELSAKFLSYPPLSPVGRV